jgi:type I restriction enzyme M protein
MALRPIYAKLVKSPAAPLRKAVSNAFIVRDPEADPVKTKHGYEPDSELRDTENVPLGEDISGFLRREVLPFAADAWVDDSKARVGYEISFTRYFFEYEPPRPLEEIDAEIKASQQRILDLLAEVTS